MNFLKTNPKLLFIPALMIGVIVLILSIALKPKLAITAAGDHARAVDVMPLQLTNIAPQVTGFGQIRPKQQWSAIAEVTGEILFKSPKLAKGEHVFAGTELLRIDPLKYELALAQAEADLNSNQLQLAKLKQEQKNLAKNLEIEQSRLLLQQQENKRLTKLTKQGMLPQSDLDTQRVQLLTQEKVVQEVSQQLALFETEKSVALAKINLSKASVAEANRAIAKTVIKAPRDIKIAQVGVEQDQVVNLNQVMLIGHALEVMEVEAQIAIHDMHTLVSSLHLCSDCTMSPKLLNKITASIELNSGEMKQTWPARVSRISETIDLNQATVGVILEITQDPSKMRPGRPPLLNGMFITASLIGQPSPQFSVPEKALHTNRIYLMDGENKLKIVPVSVLYRNQVATVIQAESGKISAGDRLVLNDLLPAIEGMSLSANDEKGNSL
ncbi:MAG: HlyD family secretion protein [Oleispira sp.]|nr:HlyD family secretion protein [Oleispira sp.]